MATTPPSASALAGDKAFITVKGPTTGMSRPEFEYPIPWTTPTPCCANLCVQPLIEKTRYDVPFGGKVWTVDEFDGENAGLVVAEVELAHPEETRASAALVARK